MPLATVIPLPVEWLSRKDAARYADVSLDTIDRLVKSKQVASTLMRPRGTGRGIRRISRTSLDACLQKGTQHRGPGRPRKA